MSPTKESRGVGKTRKNRIAHDPAPVANKTVGKPQGPENRIADIAVTKNTWSVKEAAVWAGVPERTLYRMLRVGAVPCFPMGRSQTQKLPRAKSGERKRRCYRFIIPRAAFQKAWENLGSAGSLGNPAA